MIELYRAIRLEGSRLVVEFSDDFYKTGIVKENFWADYTNFPAENLDESILNIPVLLNLAPAIWAKGLTVDVPVLDKDLFESFEKLKPVFKEMYPNLDWSGRIIPRRLQSNCFHAEESSRSALFFSGGLDSVFSTMNHLQESPMLVTVRGSDVSLTDNRGWEIVKTQSAHFATVYGLSINYIETNFYDFLNQRMLSDLDEEITGWWGGVQHGMGFAGLLAPYTKIHKLAKAYIASSHSVGFTAPWGSDPRIDDLIEYAGIKFFHDGFDFTRHGKVKRTIEVCKELNLEIPNLRVCYSNSVNASENCCQCEKCARTMTAIWVEREDPSKFGFDISSADFVQSTKARFNGIKFHFNDNTLFHWQDIKSNLKNRAAYVDLPSIIIDYLDWLESFDFVAYKRESDKRKNRKLFLKNIVKSVPGLYQLAILLKERTKKR